MKEWAKKNLSALASIIASAIFILCLIVIIAASGFGAGPESGSALLFSDIQEAKSLMPDAYGLAVSAIVIGFLSAVPVIIRLICAILNIDFLARILRLISTLLAWVSMILLVVLNVQLIQSDAFVVSVGSTVVLYILLFISAVVVTGSTIKK